MQTMTPAKIPLCMCRPKGYGFSAVGLKEGIEFLAACERKHWPLRELDYDL